MKIFGSASKSNNVEEDFIEEDRELSEELTPEELAQAKALGNALYDYIVSSRSVAKRAK